MSNKNSNKIGLNQLSFWLLVATAILYLIALVLGWCNVSSSLIWWMRSVAAALAVCVVALLAWHYVAGKPTVWKILYLVVLLIVLVGIILPGFHF